jgi:hypothetical protein
VSQPTMNETLNTKWAATEVSTLSAHSYYRLYRAAPGQAYVLVATVARNEKGWKLIVNTTVTRGLGTRKRWPTAAIAVESYYGMTAAQAILNPSKPEDL